MYKLWFVYEDTYVITYSDDDMSRVGKCELVAEGTEDEVRCLFKLLETPRTFLVLRCRWTFPDEDSDGLI